MSFGLEWEIPSLIVDVARFTIYAWNLLKISGE